MPAQSQRKSPPTSLAMRLFALHRLLPIVLLSSFVLPVTAQMQFVGNVTALPMSGLVLGGQNRMVVDPSGNVFITDPVGGQVIELHVGGTVTQLIGPSTTINGLPLNNPGGIAIDNLGNIEISDTGNGRIVVVPLAGGTPTLLPQSIANTPAPTGIAVDSSGDVFVSNPLFSHIVEIAPPAGNTTTVNTPGISLATPQGLAVDVAGDLFIADSSSAQIVEVSGGAASLINTGSATLVAPTSVTLDSGGNLYIADPAGAQVVEVPWVGSSFSAARAGVLATGSQTLISPTSVGADGNGDLYILDQGATPPQVIKLEKSAVNFGSASVGNGPGVTMTLNFTLGPNTTLGSILVGNSGGPADFTRQYSGTCAFGTSGSSSPTCTIVVNFQPQKVGLRQAVLTVNALGGGPILHLPLLGTGTGPILAFTPGILTTVAGIWGQPVQQGNFRASGNSAFVQLVEPKGIALDGAGNLYIDDWGYYGIRKLAPTGYINMTTVIGGNTNYFNPFSNPANGDGGPAINATIFDQWGVALDAAGNIYTADSGWDEVREDTVQNGMMNLVGGYWFPYYNRVAYSGDYGLAINADITHPWGVAVDARNNVYVGTLGGGVVRKIAPNGIITPFAGQYGNMGSGNGYYGDGGPASLAGMNGTLGMAFDSKGNMYIADTYNSVIRKVTPEGIISTVAGSVSLPAPSWGYNAGGYSGDGGPATQAQLYLPYSVAVDGGGNLYIADTGNSAIRMVTPNGIISTVAVLGACNPPSLQNCYTGNVPGDQQRVGSSTGSLTFVPDSIVADAGGNLFFSDDEGGVVRKLDVSDPPSLTFATLPVGAISTQQDVTLQNLGNAVLNITKLTISSNFTLGSDTTCTTGTSIVLAPGQSCVLGFAFAPVAYGSHAGAAVLTLANSTILETIPLSGSATSLSQAITFNSLPSQIAYAAGTSLALTASGGGSGNPVTFTVLSGPATIVGNVLKISAIGTVAVAANQAGNGAYTAAPQVTQSLIVSASVAPTVITQAPTSVAATTATLQASINPNNTSTMSWFSYGTTAASLTKTTSIVTGLTGTSAIAVQANIGALIPNTTYYYRATGKSTGGQTLGAVLSFTTP